MSERYSRLFSLPKNLYAAGSPVVIAAGALLKDNQTGKVLAQLKLRNIDRKPIKAATVSVKPLDTVGAPLGAPVTYQYLDLQADRDEDFGQKVPVVLPDAATRSFAASVVQVIFADNSIWNAADEEWTSLALPKRLDAMGGDLAKQFRIEYGGDCENLLLEQKDLWHCVCGAVNRQEETNCHRCHKVLAKLQAIDMEDLRQKKEDRLAREREAAEAARIKAQQEAEIAKAKAKKIGKLTAIAAVAILAVVLFTQFILPAIQYHKAIALMEAGQYEKASSAFAALDDYKDSADKITECNYHSAIALMESQQYEDAIAAFEALDDYKDSADKIIESNYLSAVALMESQQYEEAIAVFKTMNSYRDSTEWIEECEAALEEQHMQAAYAAAYAAAEALVQSGETAEAAMAFGALGDYQDARERSFSLLENMPWEEMPPVLPTNGNPVGESKTVSYFANRSIVVHSMIAQLLDNGYVRYTLDYTAPQGRYISFFNPPDGSVFMYVFEKPTSGERETYTVDVKIEANSSIDSISIKFFALDYDTGDYVSFYPVQF